MINLNTFHLVTSKEDNQLYQVQSQLLSQKNNKNGPEIILQIAILLTLPPVSDYAEAVKLLHAGFEDEKDMRLAIIGSFLSSTWENYRSNPFIDSLDMFLNNIQKQEQAIIYYLKAYDIFMRNQISFYEDKYETLLNKSVALYDGFVYPLYRLSQISEKARANILLKKALSNVKKVWSAKEIEEKEIADFISYQSFLDEHILGVTLSESNFKLIKRNTLGITR